MLRSWIDRLERRSAPGAMAGLAFSRDRIGFALLEPEGRGFVVRHDGESARGLRLDPADRATIPALAGAVRELAAGIAGRYLPVQVSLADSLAQMAVLELESVPADRPGQQSLAAFRLERDGGRKPASIDCQPLGGEDGKSFLLTASLDEDWPAYVVEILMQAGLAPASLGINLFRQFNRFHERLLAGGKGGALLTLSPDSWSVLIWDGAGRARTIRSRPRATGANDHDAVAGELERLILAFVNGGANRAVENIHVLSDDAAMANALDRRLRTPCVRLDPYEGCRREGGAFAVTTPMAIAAALA